MNSVPGVLSGSAPMEIHPTAHPKASMCLSAPGIVSPPNALHDQQHKGGPRMFVGGATNMKIMTHTPKHCYWVNIKFIHKFTITVIKTIAHSHCRLFSSFSSAITSLPGQPTLAEKAQKFIKSLGLGNRPDGAVLKKIHLSLVPTDNTTSPRQRRQSGLPVVCPASQQQQAVCTDITGKHKVILFRQKMW